MTEQTHHIIIPSYAAWFDYNRYCRSNASLLLFCPAAGAIMLFLFLSPNKLFLNPPGRLGNTLVLGKLVSLSLHPLGDGLPKEGTTAVFSLPPI